MRIILICGLVLVILAGCQPAGEETGPQFSVPFEKYELDNGLDVIFHIDRSDPVVAVALTAHVGSAREKTGRTGFAHLFEHLLFLESENLGKGGLDQMSARIGGSGANGSTSRDRTNYFQTVPANALEKMIWAEADKLGWFINTVTEPVLAKEKQVVKNEKRQGVDNRPYGHTSYVIDQHLYPAGHPYSWQVIGSLEDLQNATLADVKEFFRRWYVPNNVTLTISGDFDPAQAKEWVEKYFGEIPRGEAVTPMEPQPGQVAETIRVFHEDNFARLPELTLAWPTVPQFHPDAYPLEVLTQYLSQGKQAPLYQVLVEELKLTANVSMFNWPSELAGQSHLRVRAFADTDLDAVLEGVESALAQFAETGIPAADLDRIKAGQETDFYQGLASVLGKGFQLAQYNIFAGDPGFINEDIQNILAVNQEDVMRVYRQYFADRPYVATSFVPLGQSALALEGSSRAEVVEEAIVQGAEETFDASIAAEYDRTPSSFDRSQEPPYGPDLQTPVPTVWAAQLDNGMSVTGIENNEVPLVQFNLVIAGGQQLESLEKPGVANLLAQMMTKGTQNKTPAELEAAIEQLGASLNVRATAEAIRISGTTLATNYSATLDLLEEILLQPRWDANELELLRQEVASNLQQQAAQPNSIASQVFNELLYGEDHIRSQSILGTIASVEAIDMADLQAFYEANLSPAMASMYLVGAIDEATALAELSDLVANWTGGAVTLPSWPEPIAPNQPKVYFYDVPDAKQSVLRIGYLALAENDPEYYPATVMNYILGGGGFASRLTQELREGKGYTYGIRSGFSGSTAAGPFQIGSSVRTNVTLEATQLIQQILTDYPATFSAADLQTTQSSLIKGNARAFETAFAKLNLVENISSYGWPDNYVSEREAIVQAMTVDDIQGLAGKYLDPNKMIWLVVGDAATQLPRMEALGYGEPILLNENDLAN
jgi:zinc protease